MLKLLGHELHVPAFPLQQARTGVRRPATLPRQQPPEVALAVHVLNCMIQEAKPLTRPGRFLPQSGPCTKATRLVTSMDIPWSKAYAFMEACRTASPRVHDGSAAVKASLNGSIRAARFRCPNSLDLSASAPRIRPEKDSN